MQGTVSHWWAQTASTPSNVLEIRNAEELFNAIAKGGSSILVVEFFAGWCAACRSLYPKLCKIAASEFPDAVFLKVNIDAHEELCQELGVDRLPMFYVYQDKAVVNKFTASMTAQGLRKLRTSISSHYGPPAIPSPTLHGPSGQSSSESPMDLR